MSAIEQEITRLVEGFTGEAAFYALNLTTGAEIGYRPDRIMPTASTIKLLILAELFRQADAGMVELDQPLPIIAEDQRGGSGILKDLSPSVSLSARDHATLMTALSDNISTAVLVRHLGAEQIMASASEWGMADTSATFMGTERQYGASTPRDLVRLLMLIDTDAIGSPSASAAIRDILITQQYHEQLARYLPYSQYNRTGAEHRGDVIVRSKSGFSNGEAGGIRVDAGLIELRGGPRYAICTMTEGSDDRLFGPEHDGAILNGKLSRLVFEAWRPQHSDDER
jgi:hypothetical protein